jgi:hypothetical protein
MTTVQNSWFHRQGSFARWPLAAAAIVAAIAHIPVIGEHLEEAPYMGVLFIVLTAACFALAAVAVVYDTVAVYAAAAVTCGLAVVGYAATRLVAFPMLADDVGNWFEPLGVVSIISETVVVLFALVGAGSASLPTSMSTSRIPEGLRAALEPDPAIAPSVEPQVGQWPRDGSVLRVAEDLVRGRRGIDPGEVDRHRPVGQVVHEQDGSLGSVEPVRENGPR